MSFAHRKSSDNGPETVGKERNEAASQTGRRWFEFEPFRLDVTGRRLLRGGEPVALTSKVFDILLYFAEHGGRLMTKEEVLSAVWQDSFVEEGNLTRNVSTLRKALGDNPDDPRYIVTMPGRGYQFVPAIREVWEEEGPGKMPEPVARPALPDDPTEPAGETEPASDGPPDARAAGRVSSRRWFLALAGVAVVALVGTIWLWRFGRTTSPARITSIAVLPFKPLAAETRDESLELGMADTIIARLSNVKNVVVRPLSSVRRYSNLEQDARAAGRELGVSSVLDGSLQKTDERIRVRLRLTNVEDGRQLWAGQFDEKLSDIFAVQDAISEKVVGALTQRLTDEERERLTKRYTENPEAYQLYLQGRFHLNIRTCEENKRANDYFRRAMETDPNYALAYAGLADSWSQLGLFGCQPAPQVYPEAMAAAMTALELDPLLAEAHTSLAHIKVMYYRDLAGGEKEYQRAIKLNPNYARAHQLYGISYLAMMGRWPEALAELARAQELDPLSNSISTNIGTTLYLSRQHGQAIAQLQKTIARDPHYWMPHFWLSLAYAAKGMHPEALAHAHKSRELQGVESAWLTGYVYAVSGQPQAAQKVIDELKELSRRRYIAATDVASIYAGLGEKDQAFAWLEKAYAERAPLLDNLHMNPVYDPLRADPRYANLARRMGFTQ
jgi:TolB-like protein/DNA-binding winged helix-turn-helix (wHTH) protein/Tfp pilus assembly protein PilF